MTHILIVDDKEENLYYLQALLAGHGCAVDTARHGAEALVKARQRPPDVIISDLLMPVMDGYTLLRHWKADGQLKKIPFIVYTATYTKAEDEQLALSLGADAFILKPSEPEDFLARLHEVQARGAAFTPAMPKHPVGGEQAILKLYSETLIRKLEDKTLRLEEANLALQADITERKLAQKTANLLAAIVESSDDAIIGKDLDGNIQSWNGSAEKIFGYSAAEMLGGPIARLVPPEHLEEESQILEKIRRGESVRHFDTVRLAKDGRRIDVSVTISPIRDSTGQIVGASKVARDITERKRAEETLRRTNRELRAVSDCNQVLVRAEDENKLLQDICRIVCEKAGYRMAWVGYAVQDEGKTVRPVAWAGAEDQYLASAAVSWADTERGRGPVGAAIRTGTTTYIRDFASDSRAAPWREAALQRGFHCNIALPLKDENGHPFGALTIYSSEANSFTPDEIRLLEELAGDLAFGITTLRLRVERKRSQEELISKTALLEAQLDSTLDGILVVDTQGKRVIQNQRFLEVFEVPEEIGSGSGDTKMLRHVVSQTKNPQQFRERVAYLYAHPDEYGREEIELADGRVFDHYSAPVRDKAGEHYGRIWVFRDITERRRTEDQLLASNEAFRESEQRLRLALESGQIGVWQQDLPAGAITADDRLFDLFGIPLTKDRIIGFETWLERVHVEDRKVVAARTGSLWGGRGECQSGVSRGAARWFHPTGCGERCVRCWQR